MNLGLIVLDTLRYDTFDEYMPGIRDSAVHVYENMYSTARWTPPAHASLFTGRYPTEVGVHAGQQHLNTDEPVLAERLRRAGFSTAGLSNNINVDRFFDFDRGFDRFHRGSTLRDRPEFNASGFDWTELEKRIADGGVRRPIEALYHIVRSDAPTIPTLRTGLDMYRAQSESPRGIEWAVSALEDDRPDAADRFVFANLMTPHYPYDPPAAYSPREPLPVKPMDLTLRDEPVTEEEHDRHITNYRGAARYLDDVLQDLIGLVEWDLLFVVSDHGELFGEHGIRGHQYGVYEELTHVPAVAFGDLVEAGTTDRLTSLVDVHRTLLSAAGLDVPSDHRGLDLRSPDIDRGRVVYAESEGCEWYSPDATGVERAIPASWADPHYMLRSDDAALLVDKDGERAVDPATGEARPDRLEDLSAQVSRLRNDRVDLAAAIERETPAAVQDRLEQLGYK